MCKFCQIIRNPEALLCETERLAIFEDFSPQARKHFVIVSKDHIKNVQHLEARHKPLIREMKSEALKVLQETLDEGGTRLIDSEDASDILIGFHYPLSTSQDHLHMHAFRLPFKSQCVALRKYYNPLFFERVESTLARI